MIDLKRTLSLISGGIFDPEKTWADYLPDAGNWQKTALLLTGPLIIIAAVAAYIFGFLGSNVSLFGGFRPTLVSTLTTMISLAIGAAVFAFVVSALAGAFGGKNSFALGLAATTFAIIPSYIGQAVMWLPWIGGLLALGLFIYALILLWKIIPIYLGVPDGKRAGHYILSVVATIATMLILSMTVGRFLMPTMSGPSFGGPSLGGLSDASKSDSPFGSGSFGGIARQAELIETAENDQYDPPRNGRLGEKQVKEFIRVNVRADELRERKMQQYKAIAEKAEKNQDISLKDLGSIMGGVTDAAGLQTAEIEVVKTAGGNWAEHQWVRNSLRTAWIQKDGSSAIEHNYKLYQEFEDELADYVN